MDNELTPHREGLASSADEAMKIHFEEMDFSDIEENAAYHARLTVSVLAPYINKDLQKERTYYKDEFEASEATLKMMVSSHKEELAKLISEIANLKRANGLYSEVLPVTRKNLVSEIAENKKLREGLKDPRIYWMNRYVKLNNQNTILQGKYKDSIKTTADIVARAVEQKEELDKLKESYEGCDLYRKDLELTIKNLGVTYTNYQFDTLKKISLMSEFIDDCATSHNETRYKFKAQVIQNKLKDEPNV